MWECACVYEFVYVCIRFMGEICISIYCCVTISTILNSCYNLIKVPLFNLLLQIQPDSQLASLP